MACNMMGLPPSRVLGLPDDERYLAMRIAVERERWQVEQLAELFKRGMGT